jgi:hypothetical protein
MFSRILWIAAAGIALIAGLAWQGAFSWDHGGDRSKDRSIEARVDEAIERGFDKVQVTDEDGQTIDVPRETKQAFAKAVSALVRAETDLAMLKVRHASDKEIDAAEVRRDRAKAEVEALKSQIKQRQQLAGSGGDALGDQIRADVRETVREAVREDVRK